jgi:tetratricopeptide (TPR) repeat protein
MKALALDETLPEAHAALASVKKFHDWDWAGAEAACRRSLELNPNYAHGHRLYASVLASLGRGDEAIREILRAQELDPLSLVLSMEVAWHYCMCHDYERSIEQALSSLEMEPAFPSTHYVLGLAYGQTGRLEEAVAAFEKARAGAPGSPAPLAGLGHALARAGHAGAAEALLHELTAAGQSAWVPPYFPALIAAGLGNAAAALDWLEDGYRKRDPYLVWLKCDPRFAALHGEPRFQKLLREIGLPA